MREQRRRSDRMAPRARPGSLSATALLFCCWASLATAAPPAAPAPATPAASPEPSASATATTPPSRAEACAEAASANEDALRRFDLLMADDTLLPSERVEMRAARDSLLRAQRLCPSPDYLNNLARVSATLGSLDVALRYCLDCLDQLAPSPPASVRQLCAALEALRQAEAALLVVGSAPEGAEVIVEGDGTQPLTTPVTLHLLPGPGLRYQIRVRAPGHADVLWEPEVGRVERVERTFRLQRVQPIQAESVPGAGSLTGPEPAVAPPSPSPSPPPVPPPGVSLRRAALVCGLAGAAVAAVGGGLHTAAVLGLGRAEDELDGSLDGAAAYRVAVDGQDRTLLVAGLLYGGAGLLAGAAAVLWLAAEDGPGAAGDVLLAPAPGGVVARWRF